LEPIGANRERFYHLLLDFLAIGSDGPNSANAKRLEISLYEYICNILSTDDLRKVNNSMKRPKYLQALLELSAIHRKSKW
jgi:hypothetical protein